MDKNEKIKAQFLKKYRDTFKQEILLDNDHLFYLLINEHSGLTDYCEISHINSKSGHNEIVVIPDELLRDFSIGDAIDAVPEIKKG